MKTLRVLDLFSGIGGFALGLKKAGGFRTVGYCEIDPYCHQVLLSRMRDGSLDTAPICTDVRKLDGRMWRGAVDLICGGFPCQDISTAGAGAGIDGDQSGLWREMARLVRQVRPGFVLVENVSALLARGLGRVLGDLAAIGYDAEWDCIPASALGAPHQRDRIWIVAYPHEDDGAASGAREDQEGAAGLPLGAGIPPAVADTRGERLEGPIQAGNRRQAGRRIFAGRPSSRASLQGGKHPWDPEPSVGRMAHGVPAGVDRLSALGNAVVPQVVEWLGRRIVQVPIS